jgi:hypothetical protein
MDVLLSPERLCKGGNDNCGWARSDLRRAKGGDVIGELCASEELRPDRAVALEETEAICVPFEEVMQHVLKRPDLIAGACRARSNK